VAIPKELKNKYLNMNEISTIDFIEKLKIILFDLNVLCRTTADEFKDKYSWDDSDARYFLFNTIGQTCFLEGFTLSFVQNEILQNANNWRQNQKYFLASSNSDYEQIANQYVNHIRDSFFLNVLVNVEHGLRIFGENCAPQIIDEKIWKVRKQIIEKFELDVEYNKLFEIVFTIRNSIHNGGLISKTTSPITFKDKTFEFIEKKDTNTSLDNINFLFTEVLEFLKSLFEHEKSKSISFIEHPYKPFFN
jgi:hypothetical protein